MLAHLTALTKIPASKLPKPAHSVQPSTAGNLRSSREPMIKSDCSSLDANGADADYHELDANLNSEYETLRQHNGNEQLYSFTTSHLRPNSIQTMNSYLSSSTHTTNTNSATSVIFPQRGSTALGSVRSRESSSSPEIINSRQDSSSGSSWTSKKVQGQTRYRTLSVEENLTPRNIFRTVSNSGLTILKGQPTRPQAIQPAAQSGRNEQHPSPAQQQVLVPEDSKPPSRQTLRRSSSSLRYTPEKSTQPRQLPISSRGTPQSRENRFRPSTELGTRHNGPRSSRSHSKPAGHPPQSRSNSLASSSNLIAPGTRPSGSSVRPSSIIQAAGSDHNVSLRAQAHAKRQPLRESPSESPSPSTMSAGSQPVVPQANRLLDLAPASASTSNVPKFNRLSIQHQALKEEFPRQPVTQNDMLPAQAKPNCKTSNPVHPTARNYNLKTSVGDDRETMSSLYPIRQESAEELIQYLERLIGSDDLRLLVDVDKLHNQSIRGAEGGRIGFGASDQSQSNRKSIGNGIFGRLGWKHKRTSSTSDPSIKNKLLPRNELLTHDRRGTFGLWGYGQSRPIKGAVFGCPLEDSDAFSCVTVIGGQKHLIPIVIFSLIEEIYARGMKTPGFMRIGGKTERIDLLADLFERQPHYGDGVDLSGEDIHVLCSLFKRYLRALPEPLMSRELFHILWSHCVRQPVVPNHENLRNAVSTAQCLMRLMPPRSFSLFIYVVAFLSQIPMFPQNKFSHIGIAKVFGPALFAARTQKKDFDERPMHALKWLLENWSLATEGLLDEYFIVKFPEVTPPANNLTPSSATDGETGIPNELDEPSLEPSPVSHSSRKDPWEPGSLDLQHSRSVALLGWRSQSLYRSSVSSAQHIVDRYEANEKAIAESHLIPAESDAAEPHDESYEMVCPITPHELHLGFKEEKYNLPLAGIAEVPDLFSLASTDNLTDVLPNRNTDLVRTGSLPEKLLSAPTSAESLTDNLPRASTSKDNLTATSPSKYTPTLDNPIETEQTQIGLTKWQILVLNEPLESGTSLHTSPIPDGFSSGDTKIGNHATAEHADSGNSPLMDSVDFKQADIKTAQNLKDLSVSGNNSIRDGINLQPDGNKIPQSLGSLSLGIKLDHTRSDNPMQGVVRKTLEMIEKHQNFLAEMKSELNQLLIENFQAAGASILTL